MTIVVLGPLVIRFIIGVLDRSGLVKIGCNREVGVTDDVDITMILSLGVSCSVIRETSKPCRFMSCLEIIRHGISLRK